MSASARALRHLINLRLSPLERATSSRAVLFSHKTLDFVASHSPHLIEHLYLSSAGSSSPLPPYVSRLSAPITEVPTSFLLKASGLQTITPDSCAGLLKLPPQPSLEALFKGSNRLVVLDGVQDPGNVGTILRTCSAFGWSLLLSIGCCDVFNDKALRSSTGSSFTVPFASHQSIPDLINQCQARETLTLLTLPGSQLDIRHFTSREVLGEYERVVVVLGSESKGISSQWVASSLPHAHPVKIGPGGGVLNVSVAAAIAMHTLTI